MDQSVLKKLSTLDESTIGALLSILDDLDADDLALLTILRSSRFHMFVVENGHVRRVVDALYRLIDKYDDEVVRQYAASSLEYYVQHCGVLAKIEGIIRDDDEDIDLRYNAFHALVCNRNRQDVLSLLMRLKSVPDFKEDIEVALEDV